MKFRQKHSMVDAIQWTGDSHAVKVFLAAQELRIPIGVEREDQLVKFLDKKILVETADGQMSAAWNDFLVVDAAGFLHVYPPDAFRQKYEETSPLVMEMDIPMQVSVDNKPADVTVHVRFVGSSAVSKVVMEQAKQQLALALGLHMAPPPTMSDSTLRMLTQRWFALCDLASNPYAATRMLEFSQEFLEIDEQLRTAVGAQERP
jgi:hypothetical protein